MRTLNFTNDMIEVFNRQLRTNYKDVKIEEAYGDYSYTLCVTRHDDTYTSHRDCMILFYDSGRKLMIYHDEIEDYKPYNRIIKMIELISSDYQSYELEKHESAEESITIDNKVGLVHDIQFNDSILCSTESHKSIDLDKAKIELRYDDKNTVTFEYSLTGTIEDGSFNHARIEDVVYFMKSFIDDFNEIR